MDTLKDRVLDWLDRSMVGVMGILFFWNKPIKYQPPIFNSFRDAAVSFRESALKYFDEIDDCDHMSVEDIESDLKKICSGGIFDISSPELRHFYLSNYYNYIGKMKLKGLKSLPIVSVCDK